MVSDLIFIVVILFFVATAVLAFMKPKYISIRKIYLFRCLFPSWKFYEDICFLPILYFRVSEDGINFSVWYPAIEKIDRSWKKLFLNPEGNLIHACNSMIQQLESDKEEVPEDQQLDFINSVSYRLTKNLVISQIRDHKREEKFYQFKITSTLQGSPDSCEDTIVSAVHEIK